jgi:formamidopyrimidine-DNA glycosylase
MPELPEVELMTQDLRSWTHNQHITLQSLDSKFLSQRVASQLKGWAGTAYRRGKYTVLPIEEKVLVLHYCMTGKVVRRESPKYTRLQISVSNSTASDIYFIDTRRLGRCWVLSSESLNDFWVARRLGPEIYPESQSGAWWEKQFKGIRSPIKPALLRQDRVAGLGNICASEICFRAKVHPNYPTSNLGQEEWNALSCSTSDYLNSLIKEEGDKEIQYVTQGGDLPRSFLVYGREDQACSRCRHPIKRIKISGRATFFCSFCTP